MANQSDQSTFDEITLSQDELELLNNFDCLAYDMMRKELRKKDEAPPCWLCCSDEARAEARRKALAFLRLATGELDLTEERARKHITSRIPEHLVELWRDAELANKKCRALGNPRAFFAH